MLLSIVPIVAGALWMLSGLLMERWATKLRNEGTRQRAGRMALIGAILCFLVALVAMQLAYPANWPGGLAVAVVAVPLALAIRARWASRRRSRSGQSA
jgi:peptidoglycan/LPS O-acetylase OafA/YrhL